MRVAFVHNKWFPYSPESPYMGNAGGAALTNIAIIQEGERRGHKIDILWAYRNKGEPIPDYRKYPIEKPDLYILSHIVKFERIGFLDEIISEKKYVRWDHAYDFCVSGAGEMNDEKCIENKVTGRCKQCRKEFNKKLHEKAILSVFQSPLHKQTHEKMLNFKAKNYFILPAPIDTRLFKIKSEVKRDPNKYLAVGAMMPHKGLKQILMLIKKFPEKHFFVVGNYKNKETKQKFMELKNCTTKHHINNHLLPDIYNSAKYYIHIPVWNEPSSRTTMEAFLCGCQIICNKNVGTMSYDFMKERRPMKEIRDIIRSAPRRFWEEVEKRV